LSRRSAVRLLLVFVFTVLGAVTAYTIARIVLYRAERRELTDSAGRLMDQVGRLGTESFTAMDDVSNDGFPRCSDPDLAFMRNLVFHSSHIRDIGRSLGGKLNCSAGVGRVAPPVAIGPPDIIIRNVQFWISTWLMISTEAQGFVVERGGISVVLNPDNFKAMQEPPPRYATGFLYNRATGAIVRSSGDAIPLRRDEIVRSRFLERAGVYYQPRCSPQSMVCAVVYEARRDFLLKIRPVLFTWALAGALMGKLLSFVLLSADLRRRSVESQLRRAIRKGRLELAYQPIVELDTGLLAGVEALARWKNEQGEIVPPDVFIPLAESKGFVTEITRAVIARAMNELGDLLVERVFRMSLNITAQDLADPRFLPELEREVAATGAQPIAIGLELTERSMVDHEAATEALSRLKQAGFTLYIDDFGTGYSSLAYLHRLGVDALKIDRAFTQTIGTGAVTASVIPQILEMAKQLDLLVVVEGIETEQQAQYFQQAKPGSLGQGWLFGRPVSPETARTLIRQGTPERWPLSPPPNSNIG
jgi:sensor c-di-GMP phosphodiesterase-like protein